MRKGVQKKSRVKGEVRKRERNRAGQDILPEQGKRLKEDTGEKAQSGFQEGQVVQRSVWRGDEGSRRWLQLSESCRGFSRLLREEAAEDRRRLELQQGIRRIIVNISLISVGFGLGWIMNWKNRSMAICQCL